MDDLVHKALARWPNVPAIAGWLRLTAQGEWLLTGPVPQGLTISNARILNFIARNYAAEDDGRYYFQNGPQKAYVSLECTPWIYRVYPLDDGSDVLVTHTGLICLPDAMYTDEQGRALIHTSVGIGLLHSTDMARFSDGLVGDDGAFIHKGVWTVPENPAELLNTRIALRKNPSLTAGRYSRECGIEELDSASLPNRFHFQPDPEV
ncbi:MAG TPA: DUF2946 family protein [Limnobacter sp.]|uniref:DUF2946 family protein n=1 Tax=Limnobacter sp. TaxID=2003368 RepID=UPI002E3129F7|nr:DUF2946 family protein [Limnobacter sp.]HEX5485612.1 DUF2946 family protein [Limnobacter sp.]